MFLLSESQETKHTTLDVLCGYKKNDKGKAKYKKHSIFVKSAVNSYESYALSSIIQKVT